MAMCPPAQYEGSRLVSGICRRLLSGRLAETSWFEFVCAEVAFDVLFGFPRPLHCK